MNGIGLENAIASFNVKNTETSKVKEKSVLKEKFSKTLQDKQKSSHNDIKKDYRTKDNSTKVQDEDAKVSKDSKLDINSINDEVETVCISEEKPKNTNLQELISMIEVLTLNFTNTNVANEDLNKLKEILASNMEILKNNSSLDDSLKVKLHTLLGNLNVKISQDKLHTSLDPFKQDIKEELISLVKEAKENIEKSTSKNQVIFKSNEENFNKNINVISSDLNKESDDFSNLNSNKFSREENLLKNLSKDSSEDSNFTRAINFINHLNPTVENIKASTEENIVINKANFANDILKTVKYMESNNLKDLTVKINPKELGEIIIKITVESGTMKASITAQNKEAFNLLNANLLEINDKLQQNNIRIDNLNINIYEDTTFFRGGSHNENNEKQQNKKNNSAHIEEELDVNGISEELNNLNMFA